MMSFKNLPKNAQILESDDGKLPVTLAASNFQKLFVMKCESESSLFKHKILFSKGFITKKKTERGAFFDIACKIELKHISCGNIINVSVQNKRR